MIATRWARGCKNTKILLGTLLCVFLIVWKFQSYRTENKETNANADIDEKQFFGADHPYIHYVGRWITTADGKRKEACFSDSYFDIKFNGSSILLVSLHNNGSLTSKLSNHYPEETIILQHDQLEYFLYTEATGVVSTDILDNQEPHKFRIIAPLIRPSHDSCIQINGIWLDEGASLLPVSDSEIQMSSQTKETDSSDPSVNRKWLEIVSDTPGDPGYSGYNDSIQQAIHKVYTKWEYLLGDMLGIDHTIIGMDGMCLIHSCIGGTGAPLGIGELYFRSAAYGSNHSGEIWRFPSKAPDVMVLNLGTADMNSFQQYYDKYDTDWAHLTSWFEDSYITLVQSIRNLAYSAGEIELEGISRYSSQSKSSNMPIFVMRPFRGQLEGQTRSVVDRLQQQGDNSIYWVDTSGWFNTAVDFEKRQEDQDFFLDELGPAKQWRLTERGHQRAAILLHSHVCRYLARNVEECPFLPPHMYDEGQYDNDDGPRFEEREAELDWEWSKT